MTQKSEPKPRIKVTRPGELKAKRTQKTEAADYKHFKLQKKIPHGKPDILGSFKLFKAALVLLKQNWKLIGGILGIYFLVSLIIVRGPGSYADLSNVKSTLTDYLNGSALNQLAVGAVLAGTLLSTVGKAASESASAYQTALLIMFSLALIWAIRNAKSNAKVTIKDAFYKSMHPLVPFILVLLVIMLQLIPLGIAGQIVSLSVSGGLAVGLVEIILIAVIMGLVALLSLYMVTASVFALYIVTLPEVTPLEALRGAKELVRLRRWTVMRKVLFLPIALLVVGTLIMFPIALLFTPIAETVFYALTIVGVAVVHAYMYSLYRELIK